MPIVLNGSTGITTEGMNVDTIVDTAGTGSPSVPNGFEQMFVLPVGTLMWFTGNTAPGGYLVADGTLHSRAAYPDLWSWIVTSGNLAVSDSAWDEGQYSPGDGSTTFRVPKVDDRFIRGKSGSRAVGLVEEDAIRNITGKTGYMAGGSPEGAFTSSDTLANGTFGGGGEKYRNIFDASHVVPTADENRPKALTMLPCIKAFDSVVQPSVLNAAEMVSTINGKLDKNQNIVLGASVAASGTAVDFVGIPEGVKRVTVMFDGVSTNGASRIVVQIGSDTIETSGYVATATGFIATGQTVQSSTGFIHGNNSIATSLHVGSFTLQRDSLNKWTSTHIISTVTNTVMYWGSGNKLLSNPLGCVRITTENGTDQFDAGTINISWEF